jgi:hypothetical protein
MIREALDLYKRELDIIEANHKRQVAILEANGRRVSSWRSKVPYIVALILMGAIMGILLPVTDHLLNR